MLAHKNENALLKSKLFELIQEIDKCSITKDYGELRKKHYENMDWVKENGYMGEYYEVFSNAIRDDEDRSSRQWMKDNLIKKVHFLPERKLLRKYVVVRNLMGEFWYIKTTDDLSEAVHTKNRADIEVFESGFCEKARELNGGRGNG